MAEFLQKVFGMVDLDNFSSFTVISIVLAVAATFSAFLTSSLGSIYSVGKRKTRSDNLETELEKLNAGENDVNLDDIDFDRYTRFNDLKDLQERYRRQARRNAFSFNSLVFGQYIIGALLASSFVQESLNGQLVGFLGVLVLLSSAIQQRFRPDLLAMQARSRMTVCSKILRKIEDGIFLIKSRIQDAPTIIDLRSTATLCLDELDRAEFTGMENYYEIRQKIDDVKLPQNQLNIQPEPLSDRPVPAEAEIGAASIAK